MSNTYKDNSKHSGHEIISVPENVSILVIGDIHEHSEQFNSVLNKWKPSKTRWIVSLGDVYDKGYGPAVAEKITNKLIELNAFAVRGNHELKIIKKNKKELSPELKWWKNRPLAITFNFYTGKQISIVHAGVSPVMTQLGNDVEVCYVRDVDCNGQMIPLVWKMINGTNTLVKSNDNGQLWHNVYDGRFGYIISGHAAQKDGEAKYFTNSCNIDSGIYETGKLTSQIILSSGELGDKIVVEGPARKPELNIGY
jgi:predicted MPP superfamily phosphohydrolase